MASLKKAEVRKIEIPQVQWARVEVTLVGITPLIVHNFDEKTKSIMADAQAGAARMKKAPKIPKECYERARLRDSRGKDCIRALWIKCACVDAARYVEGVKMTELRGALRIEGDMIPIQHKKLRMRCDSVRNQGGVADLRYRPEYDDWTVRISVLFRENMLTAGSVINLLNNAGSSVGLCERRPGQNGDSFGMFEVQASRGAKRGRKAA